jgi:hypothetical protein
MSIITPSSKCALCGELLIEGPQKDVGIFCFPATGLGMDFMNDDSRYARFDDCGVHQSCVQSWNGAIDFIDHWNQHVVHVENGESMKLVLDQNGMLRYANQRANKST